jgi:hypothetical protein
MQNRYAGDIGDFGKFGLLRAIFPDSQLGIIWYLVPDESHNKDGRHIDYLKKTEFRVCDAELFDKLNSLIRTGHRSVEHLQQLKLLYNAVFFPNILSYDGTSANSEAGQRQRLSIRRKWLDNALQASLNCEALFLDPDNGLEIKSVVKHSESAIKYVFMDELKEFTKICPCVAVYQHFNRQGKHSEQIQGRVQLLWGCFGETHRIFALKFKRYSPRAYFLLIRKEKADYIKNKLEMFIRSTWCRCFDEQVYNRESQPF